MRYGVIIKFTSEDRARLQSIIRDRNAPQKHRFIAEANDKPKPFLWTKFAEPILAAVQRGRQALEAIH